MVLMKKGNDTRYVADIFIPNYLSKGYEVIFPKKKTEAPAPVVVEAKSEEAPKPNDDDKTIIDTASTVNDEVEITEPVEAKTESESAENTTEDVEAKPDDTVQPTEAPSEKKTMSCPVCGKQYSKKAYLLKHIEKEHPGN